MADVITTQEKLSQIVALATSLAEQAKQLPTEEIDIFENRMAELEELNDDLTYKVTEANDQIEELNGRVENLEGGDNVVTPDEFEEFKHATEDDLEDHQKTINALRGNIEVLEARHAALLDRVALLELKMESHPASV